MPGLLLLSMGFLKEGLCRAQPGQRIQLRAVTLTQFIRVLLVCTVG